MDYYKTFSNLKDAFKNFAMKVPFYGSVVACGDDPAIEEVFLDFPKRIIRYGFNSKNDYRIEGRTGLYKVFSYDKLMGEFSLNVPGKHNALNALSAIIVGIQAGLTFEQCKAGLARFQGVDRRFHFKGESSGVLVYDDYGHHPTEVRATLQGFKEKFSDRRVVVLFQPHRYSRTESCWNDFTECFSDADLVLITDIYAAGESPIQNIDSETLVKELKHSNKKYLTKGSMLASEVKSHLKKGDVFVTLGAGDNWKTGLEVLKLMS